ncbi:fucolectin-like isoform X2 [Triplophysa rosa]|uniref:fucolectin-like isoform X2 n=1 Tax=Triplophysa rosa TaxID=992332 RepID=UPI002545C038|nr:fucolectin-like isoform X2 [Triplophysa rosa]
MDKLIHLILLSGFVSIQGNLDPLEENLASKGTATQPSIHSARVAENAIDGVKHGLGVGEHCAITDYQTTPWWRLDLLDYYYIDRVVITNRIDCCPHQTIGAEIRIGNSLENNGNNNPICSVTADLPLGVTAIYLCHGMKGRYVNVVMTGIKSFLSLCEVEVYRAVCPTMYASFNSKSRTFCIPHPPDDTRTQPSETRHSY